MKRLLSRVLLLLGITLFLMVGTQRIASAQQSNDKDITKAELQAFDTFLDGHPAIAADLRKNPSLVNDSSYLKRQPELASFLQSHPHAAEELKENPSAFMSAEGKYEKAQGENPATEDTGLAQQEKALDHFLDTHPQIAKDLRSNPSLANDPNYLKRHPQLSGFLANHPNLRYELSQNPNAFIKGAEAGEGRTQPNPKDNDKEKDKDKDHR